MTRSRRIRLGWVRRTMRRIRARARRRRVATPGPPRGATPGSHVAAAGRLRAVAGRGGVPRLPARPRRPAGPDRRPRLGHGRLLFHDGHHHDRRLRRHRPGLGPGAPDRRVLRHARADLRLAHVPGHGVPAHHPATHRGMAHVAFAARIEGPRHPLRLRPQRLDRRRRTAAAGLGARADRRDRPGPRGSHARGRPRLHRPARRCVERGNPAGGRRAACALGHRERRPRRHHRADRPDGARAGERGAHHRQRRPNRRT